MSQQTLQIHLAKPHFLMPCLLWALSPPHRKFSLILRDIIWKHFADSLGRFKSHEPSVGQQHNLMHAPMDPVAQRTLTVLDRELRVCIISNPTNCKASLFSWSMCGTDQRRKSRGPSISVRASSITVNQSRLFSLIWVKLDHNLWKVNVHWLKIICKASGPSRNDRWLHLLPRWPQTVANRMKLRSQWTLATERC